VTVVHVTEVHLPEVHVPEVHVVVPDGIDDPLRPSGGNVYDRRVCSGLSVLGWSVVEHPVAGPWPLSDAASRERLTDLLASIPDASLLLVDGLIASAVPDVLIPETARLRLAVLVHMPLGDDPRSGDAAAVRAQEGAVLASADAVVVTSRWTQRWLLDHYALRAGRVHVVEPGVDPAEQAPGTPRGAQLLCVAAVSPGKGHDVLLAALALVEDLAWQCLCVGSLTNDPGFVEELRRQVNASPIVDRVTFAGPCTGSALDAAWGAADLLVLASRAETYGMVVVEALARGIPVIASDVGGVPEALGLGDERPPGLLVPPGDAVALAAALRSWLVDAELRERLRGAARQRGARVSDWSVPAAQLADVLRGLAA
jgi:glycosyltransferase involved in cell wall biosynthesis